MNYAFFDYKYNIQNFTSDLFSVPHIIYIALVFIGVPIICYFFRKANHKKIDKFIKFFSIFFLLFEITKIVWESYYDITLGHGFNKEGLLPIYTCSLFIYTMLFAGWGNGKIKEYSLSYITTVSLVCGAIGVVYCNGLNYYPFWTFGAFYSLIFHSSMFFFGVFLLFTRYKKLEWKDALKAWVPMLILSLIAIPINYTYGADYMLIYNAGGVPVMSSLADYLASKNLRFVFTYIMMITYIPLGAVVICLSKTISRIIIRKE